MQTLCTYCSSTEYQHDIYVLCGIENQCQNIHVHKSTCYFHCYKCTDYQHHTHVRSGVASLCLVWHLLLSIFTILLINSQIQEHICLGNLLLILQSETWKCRGVYTLTYRCFGRYKYIIAFFKISRISVAVTDRTKR